MAGLDTRSNETGSIPSTAAVQQLLCDLQQDVALQASLTGNDSQGVLDICAARGVYVNPTLLEQFIAQLTAEEQADQELSLEQLEDIAGGFGVVDTLVSSLVLAVVASNAEPLMHQVHAGTGLRESAPVASLASTPAIASQVNTLEALGIHVVVGDPSIQGASAEWDASRRTMTISPKTMAKGASTVMQATNHEAVHVAQSCKAGSVNNFGAALGIPTSDQAVERIQHAVYENASDHAKHLEVEAYSLDEQAGAGIRAAIDHCSEAA